MAWDWGDGLQAGTGLCFVNGVHLPQGAKVTAVTVWYEGGSGASLHAELTRHKFSDGVSATLAIANLTDSTTVRTSGALAVTAANATIDNRMYSYAFGICLHSGNFFHAARITYKYDNAGD